MGVCEDNPYARVWGLQIYIEGGQTDPEIRRRPSSRATLAPGER
jgi:hypothetical protein